MIVYFVRYNPETGSWSQTAIDSLARTTDMGPECSVDDVTITNSDEIIVVYQKNQISFVDSKKKVLLSKKKISEEWNFKKSDQNRGFLHPIKGTDNLVSLNTNDQLVFIEWKDQLVIHKSKASDGKFTDFQIQSDILCALDNNNLKLICFDLKHIFDKKTFEVDLPNDSMSAFSISPNCEYIATVHDLRILSLYRVKDSMRIAHMPVYSRVNSISLSDEYITLAMHDRRLIAYLIVDVNNAQHSQRIANLESRFV